MTKKATQIAVQTLLPTPLRSRLKAARVRLDARAGLGLSHVFGAIYEEAIWGHRKGALYCSGMMSKPDHSRGFEEYVAAHIAANANIAAVLDIGCGDFTVARRMLKLLPRAVRYIGCDVAGNVIAHNRAAQANDPNVTFIELDATRDPLPDADLVIVRETFQHLSNADVAAVIRNMRSRHAVAIIADSVSKNATRLNADIESGDRTRRSVRSGVFVEATPFDLHVLDRRQELLSPKILMRMVLAKL